MLLPTLWVGASEHHLPFGGTLTVRTETHIALLTELLRPLLADGYRRLLILNAHGGNTDTIHVALRRLQQEFPEVLLTGAGFWALAAKELEALCESPQDGPWHAGEVETSLIKTIRPDLVREAELVDCDRPLPEVLRGLYISRDMAQSTQDGFLGYPAQGTAKKGEKFLEASVTRAVEVCEELLTMDLPRVRTPKTD
jgi:creatinine amidohydrolase